MAYEPTNWKSGDVVTSAKLNKIEGGISSGGVLVVTEDAETHALDHTWQELYNAAFVVMKVASGDYTEIGYADTFIEEEANYSVSILTGSGAINYKTNTANGYPVLVNNG